MEKIVILDFGSQYTQLIARAVREANVYCEITPFNKAINFEAVKGVILSGSPASVNEPDAPNLDIAAIHEKVPILGICYGAQLVAKNYGGRVEKSDKREYGRATLQIKQKDRIVEHISDASQVWMSHSDSIKAVPESFSILADTESIPVAIFKKDSPTENALYGLQFHPEVYHSVEGKTIIRNFLIDICGCHQDWTPAHFINDTIEQIRIQAGEKKVIMALSGGVDSTVAATLIQKAIGDRFYGIFVDNGLLRKNEFQEVLDLYAGIGLHVIGVDAKPRCFQV